jgi:hypothetical protein
MQGYNMKFKSLLSVVMFCLSITSCNFNNNLLSTSSRNASQINSSSNLSFNLKLFNQNQSLLPHQKLTVTSAGEVLDLETDQNGQSTFELPWIGDNNNSQSLQEVMFAVINPIGDRRYFRLLIDKKGKYNISLNLDSNGALNLISSDIQY